jgi:hypothetical protein
MGGGGMERAGIRGALAYQGRACRAIDHDDFGSNRSKIRNVIDLKRHSGTTEVGPGIQPQAVKPLLDSGFATSSRPGMTA